VFFTGEAAEARIKNPTLLFFWIHFVALYCVARRWDEIWIKVGLEGKPHMVSTPNHTSRIQIMAWRTSVCKGKIVLAAKIPTGG
jgi:hypothetical protein